MTEKEDRFSSSRKHIESEHDCPGCRSPVTVCCECDNSYCPRCDEHVVLCDNKLLFAESHSASDVARAVGTLANPADKTGLQFGKIFEEEYQQYWYRRQRGGFGGYGSMKYAYFPKRVFSRRIAYRLREDGIYSSERVAHAVRLFSAFLAADIQGLTPPTRHRWYRDSVIYGKPDLRKFGGDPNLIEFKIAPLDEYARIQTTVMSWCSRRRFCSSGQRRTTIRVGLISKRR